MKHGKETPKVRLCAYPADWLLKDGFASKKKVIWSTGQNTNPGDIQVFAISSTLGHARSLENDRRRDSVHSIWIATTPPDPEYAEEKWPVQAAFTLLVKLRNPVPKSDLFRAGLLKKSWPRHWHGKIFHNERDVRKLGEVLARKNPRQRRMIFDALNI